MKNIKFTLNLLSDVCKILVKSDAAALRKTHGLRGRHRSGMPAAVQEDPAVHAGRLTCIMDQSLKRITRIAMMAAIIFVCTYTFKVPRLSVGEGRAHQPCCGIGHDPHHHHADRGGHCHWRGGHHGSPVLQGDRPPSADVRGGA